MEDQNSKLSKWQHIQQKPKNFHTKFLSTSIQASNNENFFNVPNAPNTRTDDGKYELNKQHRKSIFIVTLQQQQKQPIRIYQSLLTQLLQQNEDIKQQKRNEILSYAIFVAKLKELFQFTHQSHLQRLYRWMLSYVQRSNQQSGFQITVDQLRAFHSENTKKYHTLGGIVSSLKSSLKVSEQFFTKQLQLFELEFPQVKAVLQFYSTNNLTQNYKENCAIAQIFLDKFNPKKIKSSERKRSEWTRFQYLTYVAFFLLHEDRINNFKKDQFDELAEYSFEGNVKKIWSYQHYHHFVRKCKKWSKLPIFLKDQWKLTNDDIEREKEKLLTLLKLKELEKQQNSKKPSNFELFMAERKMINLKNPYRILTDKFELVSNTLECFIFDSSIEGQQKHVKSGQKTKRYSIYLMVIFQIDSGKRIELKQQIESFKSLTSELFQVYKTVFNFDQNISSLSYDRALLNQELSEQKEKKRKLFDIGQKQAEQNDYHKKVQDDHLKKMQEDIYQQESNSEREQEQIECENDDQCLSNSENVHQPKAPTQSIEDFLQNIVSKEQYRIFQSVFLRKKIEYRLMSCIWNQYKNTQPLKKQASRICWQFSENIRFLSFLIINKPQFQAYNNLQEYTFNLMSQFVCSKNSKQCASHYLRYIQFASSIDQFIKHLIKRFQIPNATLRKEINRQKYQHLQLKGKNIFQFKKKEKLRQLNSDIQKSIQTLIVENLEQNPLIFNLKTDYLTKKEEIQIQPDQVMKGITWIEKERYLNCLEKSYEKQKHLHIQKLIQFAPEIFKEREEKQQIPLLQKYHWVMMKKYKNGQKILQKQKFDKQTKEPIKRRNKMEVEKENNLRFIKNFCERISICNECIQIEILRHLSEQIKHPKVK